MKTVLSFGLIFGLAFAGSFGFRQQEVTSVENEAQEKSVEVESVPQEPDTAGMPTMKVESVLTADRFIGQLVQDGPSFVLDLSVELNVSVTMLGVHVTEPSRTLRRHIQLQPGMGLVVENVVGESAAKEAGLKVDDVLVRFGDQLLVNEEQLTTLVRNREPGDSVKLEIIREGEELSIEVELRTGEIGAAALDSSDEHPAIFESHPHWSLKKFETSHKALAASHRCQDCHK